MERPDVNFQTVAVDFLPPAVQRVKLLSVAAKLALGKVCGLPQTTYSMGSVVSAFRQMSQARHIGKVVLKSEQMPCPDEHQGRGTVAITGGMGMLGSLVGFWLAKNGTAHLKLLGRSGRTAGGQLPLLNYGEISSLSFTRADATSCEEMHHALEANERDCPPTTGLIHAGGMLSDGTVLNQTNSNIRQVFAPKVSCL
jgi:hypothetical protein